MHFLSGSPDCDLSIVIERVGADDPTLAVTSVSVRGFACGLASAADFATATTVVSVGTLTVEPRMYCEGRIDLLCEHGTFAIEITDRIPSRPGPAELTFLGPITFSGTLCGETN